MNCGGYLFKLGEVTATPRRVQLGRGELEGGVGG